MNIIITGATRGIGLSHAVYLSNKGHNIALIDISKNAGNIYGETENIDSLRTFLSNNGTINRFYECDLTILKDTQFIFNKIFPINPIQHRNTLDIVSI